MDTSYSPSLPHEHPLITGPYSVYPPRSGFLHRRRQLLLLPGINTEERIHFLVDKEKEEKSPKIHLDDVLVSVSSSDSSRSKSVAFIPLILKLFGFQNLVFLLALAIHAQSFPFSDRLCLIILGSLL